MIILGIGTNVGDRLAYLEAAIEYLNKSGFKITAISDVYESPALLKPGAPEEWNVAYLNIAVTGETILAPQALLSQVKLIEKQIGRQDRGVWAPREIDIDILAYSDLVVDEDNLKIPHVFLCERDFAILPLAEIAPNWKYPVKGANYGKNASEIASLLINKLAKKTKYKLNLLRN